MTNTLSARSLAAVAVLSLAIPAHAGVILTANYTGSFDAATTFDGSALGSDTDFSITANFDASVNKLASPREGVFQITDFTLTLAGHGTYVGIPDNNSNVDLYYAGGTTYAGGLISADAGHPMISWFSSSTPAIDVTAPTPATFGSFSFNLYAHDYNLQFIGVAGGLTPHNAGATTPTFSIITAVPEPMETAGVIGLGLVGFAAWRRRKV